MPLPTFSHKFTGNRIFHNTIALFHIFSSAFHTFFWHIYFSHTICPKSQKEQLNTAQNVTDYCECKKQPRFRFATLISSRTFLPFNVTMLRITANARSNLDSASLLLGHFLHSNESQNIKRTPRVNSGVLSIFCNSQ